MMRKVLVGIGMTALVAVSGIRVGTANTAEIEPNLYPNVGYVTEVDVETDTVTWNDGWNDWTFYGVEDWMVGDGIAVIMSDEGNGGGSTGSTQIHAIGHLMANQEDMFDKLWQRVYIGIARANVVVR